MKKLPYTVLLASLMVPLPLRAQQMPNPSTPGWGSPNALGNAFDAFGRALGEIPNKPCVVGKDPNCQPITTSKDDQAKAMAILGILGLVMSQSRPDRYDHDGRAPFD